MRRPTASEGGRIRRLAAFALFASVLVAQGASELDHALGHAAAAATVHDEASHPGAAPHVDQEEHLGFEECLRCINGSKTIVHPSPASSTLVNSDSSAPVIALAPVRKDARVAGPPRAPPA